MRTACPYHEPAMVRHLEAFRVSAWAASCDPRYWRIVVRRLMLVVQIVLGSTVALACGNPNAFTAPTASGSKASAPAVTSASGTATVVAPVFTVAPTSSSGLPLYLYWLVDRSGSMAGDKIQTLNSAMRQAIPLLQRAAEAKQIKVLIQVITFDTNVDVGPAPIAVESFVWTDLRASGGTNMGGAFRALARELRGRQTPECGPPPVLVLMSDGQGDGNPPGGLREIMAERDGRRAVRVSVAIGRDADLYTLQDFIGNTAMKPLSANDPQALIDSIQWISTEVTGAASKALVARTGGSVGDGCAVGTDVLMPPTPTPRPVRALTSW